jgi:hypothetical protein
MADDAQGFFGQRSLSSSTSGFNHNDFQGRQLMSEARTGVPVKIIAVHGGGMAGAPTVDVQILVKQQDLQGNTTSHGIIYGIPVHRQQGGGNAIINDPAVGDVGHMSISDRDISSLKANAGAESNPGSQRTHDLADGIYMGRILNPANPDQAVQFTETGVKIFGKGGGVMEITGGDLHITGNLIVSGEVTAMAGGASVTLSQHVHPTTPPGPEAPPLPGS